MVSFSNVARLAKKTICVSSDIDVIFNENFVVFLKNNNRLQVFIPRCVSLSFNEKRFLSINVTESSKKSLSCSGTVAASIKNSLTGLTVGYSIKLVTHGVGYKFSISARSLGMALGFSNLVLYDLPDGVEVVLVSPTEILVQSVDKVLLGKVCAEIRSFRPPEPYKGKGVRYSDELVKIKEVKKK